MLGEENIKLNKRIGELMQKVTGEKRSANFLTQRVSVAVQKGNAASILGTIPADTNLDKIYTYDKTVLKQNMYNEF